MKKILVFVFLFFSLFVVGNGVSVFAAEEETVETPVVEEKIYTYIDEEGSLELTLVTESTYSLFAKMGETEATLSGTYVLEENIITLYLADQLFGMYILDNETMTMVEQYEEEIIYPCYVVVKNMLNGDVTPDIVEGNIGDIVTLKVQPYVFCKLVRVTVNGVDLLPNELGKYTFMLAEGENLVSAEFVVDKEDMQIIVDMINNAEMGNWEDIFSLTNLANLISWAISLIVGSGLLITLVKTKKIKAKTTEEVAEETKKTIQKTVKSYLDEAIFPLLEKQASKIESSNHAIYTMARCMTLAQENTEGSRLAIVDELTKLVVSDTALATQVKSIIAEEVSKVQQEKEAKKTAIEELEEANEKITDLGVSGRI
jgi:hypothetical protein